MSAITTLSLVQMNSQTSWFTWPQSYLQIIVQFRSLSRKGLRQVVGLHFAWSNLYSFSNIYIVVKRNPHLHISSSYHPPHPWPSCWLTPLTSLVYTVFIVWFILPRILNHCNMCSSVWWSWQRWGGSAAAMGEPLAAGCATPASLGLFANFSSQRRSQVPGGPASGPVGKWKL